jgi:hypothetical protein
MKYKRNTNRPVRLGAMAQARNRTSDEPTYQQMLTKHGLLPRGATIAEAWQLWQNICEDRKVRTMAQEIERPKHHMVASITAGYQHFGKVLAMLSARQMTALKKRIEISQERR